jgi:hypothetical protein
MRQPGIAIIIPPALCEIRRQIRSVLLHAQNLREKRFYLDGGISAAARHSRILSSVAVAPPRTTMSGDFSASPRITPVCIRQQARLRTACLARMWLTTGKSGANKATIFSGRSYNF